MISIYLSYIHCDEGTDEVGDDSPYVLAVAADLKSTPPASGTVVYPFTRMFTGRRAAFGEFESLWGIGGIPAPLVDPDDAILIIAMMERDDGNPALARGIVATSAAASLVGSIALPRPGKVNTLIRNIDSARNTPTGVPNRDDEIGPCKELRFTSQELKRVNNDAEIVTKTLVFEGDGGKYTLMFDAHPRNWSVERQGVGVGTSYGPALAVFNRRLYAAWKGVNGDSRMFWSSFDGTNWSSEQQGVGVGTSHGPALAAFNGRLYAAWKGVAGDSRMFWSSFDGTNWSPEQKGVGLTSHGPALAECNGQLYSAWKGVDGDTRMFWSVFDGKLWSPEQQGVGVGTSRGPALATYRTSDLQQRLLAGWKGVPGDNRMFWSTFDGSTWSAEQQGIGVGTSDGPALASFNGRIIGAWKGVPTDIRMFWSSFRP
jgi:hypothetical protein